MWRSSEHEENLIRAQNEILRLNSENEKLRDLLKNVEEQLDSLSQVHKNSETAEGVKEEEKAERLREEVSSIVDGPSKRYEQQRRKVRRDINEFWFFVRSKMEAALKISQDKSIQVRKAISDMLELFIKNISISFLKNLA